MHQVKVKHPSLSLAWRNGRKLLHAFQCSNQLCCVETAYSLITRNILHFSGFRQIVWNKHESKQFE